MLNLSERRITALITAGILPARGPQGFDLVASVRGYIAFLKSEPGSLKTERTRCAKLKADLLDLQYKQRCGELMERAEVYDTWFRGNRAIRDSFLNLPPRTAALVASESDQHKCFDILQAEVLQILEALTNVSPDA